MSTSSKVRLVLRCNDIKRQSDWQRLIVSHDFARRVFDLLVCATIAGGNNHERENEL
jgi:hypothetical protein